MRTSHLWSRPAVRLGVLAALVALAGACKLDEITVPPGEERIAVHGVLNPFGPQEFVVLVERTLTGRVETVDTTSTPDDPIASGGGSPVTGAEVTITGPRGSARGIEDVTRSAEGRGRGVYRFIQTGGMVPPPNGIVIQRGERYVLRIRTGDGREVRASTLVPTGVLVVDTLAAQPLDVERDTFRLSWPRGERTRAYALQIQTPYGPFQLFTNDTSVALTGDLRNVFAHGLPRAFVPGFRTTVSVASVDTNYFDYYRSFNNPFTGTGILNRVENGIGVFGAYVPILTRRVEVVAPVDHPIEGEWVRVDLATGERLRLFLDGAALVSGRYVDALRQERGVLGSRSGVREASRVSLAVLRGTLASDTSFTYQGEQRGDSLLLEQRAGTERANVVYRRVP